MGQTILVAALVIVAAVYVGLRLRRSLVKPSCLCDDPGSCPYAGQTPPDNGSCAHHRDRC